jgi:hypothetical protein
MDVDSRRNEDGKGNEERSRGGKWLDERTKV